MKWATYLILGVVALFVICAVVSAIVMALQIVGYVLIAIVIMWVVGKVATWLNKPKTNQPP